MAALRSRPPHKYRTISGKAPHAPFRVDATSLPRSLRRRRALLSGERVEDLEARLLGDSDAMVRLRSIVPKIARSDAPTLITGSTGTGKEHCARTIHALSERHDAPFVAINCGAVPDSLFEAELFGFERGSFTGAVRSQTGKAVIAGAGGTLFLDEVGELSPFSQVKLLRLLEEKEVQPIGREKPVKVDLRVIAATNRDVEQQVEQGSFRADLYYRLNVARLTLPDLSERAGDIALYIRHFVERFNRRRGCQVTAPDDALLDVLLHYDWPGNIREVRNFVEAIFIDPPRGAIRLDHIPDAFVRLQRSFDGSGKDERARIRAALDRTDWNRAEAARALSWSRMTLYRKMTKYEMTRGGPEGPEDGPIL